MLRTLPVDALTPGKYQPRRTMDQAKLVELAESIKAQGVIQPIVVRDLGGKKLRDHRRRTPLARYANSPAWPKSRR